MFLSPLPFSFSERSRIDNPSRFAGSDTTAIGMRSVFYHLMRNKQVYDTIMEEIDIATKEGRLSSPVKYAQAIKLPYLCACIKEVSDCLEELILYLPHPASMLSN
jgi:hypothetical protein